MTLYDKLFNRRDALQVFISDINPASEACVDSGVFQMVRLLGMGVQQGLDVVTLAGIMRVVGRPNRFGLDNQCFAIRVKRVGHGRDSSCKDSVWGAKRFSILASEEIQKTLPRVESTREPTKSR
jgi:hypothetical protein